MSLTVACWTAKEILTGGKSSKKFLESLHNLEKIRRESDTSCFDAIMKPLQDYVQSVQDRNKNKCINILVNYKYSLRYHNADVIMQMLYSNESEEEPFMSTLKIKGIEDREVENIITGFNKKYSLPENGIFISCNDRTLSISDNIPVVACFLDYLGINGGTWKTTGKADVTLFEVVDIDF